MKLNDRVEIRARIEVIVVHREPPATAEEGMLRAQGQLAVQEMAHKLERGVEQTLIDLLDRRDHAAK